MQSNSVSTDLARPSKIPEAVKKNELYLFLLTRKDFQNLAERNHQVNNEMQNTALVFQIYWNGERTGKSVNTGSKESK